MSTLEKTIASWDRISEEQYSTVKSTLESRGFELASQKGSHFTFRHPLISECYKLFPEFFPKDFAPDGSLIIVQHKNKVKRWYLRNAVIALEKLKEIEEANRRR